MTDEASNKVAHQPGSPEMPVWNVGELPDAPHFTWRNWIGLLGPGLVAGGGAIGGGEWLLGPTVTAKYGGSLMWLATFSIVFQVIYNIEICRYTLYSGEPIFSGKFRTLPGPLFWLVLYVFLDFGSIFPYLASNAATPVFSLLYKRVPTPDDNPTLKLIGCVVLMIAFLPMFFGGKVYRSLKWLMGMKIVVVMGFLLVVALFYSSWNTWRDILTGFGKFGNIPIERAEDLNGNGVLDAGEQDWDNDRRADRVEPKFGLDATTNEDGTLMIGGKLGGRDVKLVPVESGAKIQSGARVAGVWFDFDGDGRPDPKVALKYPPQDGQDLEVTLPEGNSKESLPRLVVVDNDGSRKKYSVFVDFDGDGTRDGDSVTNVFTDLMQGKSIPAMDLTMIAFLAGFAAIAGNGGLTNMPISNYTRDQGWGMGAHVGAIPSIVGGQEIHLSHEGTVFEVNERSMARWKRWYRHLCRDQWVVWFPACVFGVALPSMLSVQFLKRGTVADNWTAAGMTAQGVADTVSLSSGQTIGNVFWFMTMFCGALVLIPSMATTIDGFTRRWVDVFWTGSRLLRRLDPSKIRYVYFAVLCFYLAFGLFCMLVFNPAQLVKFATNIFNFALGFSCWHTIYVNHSLMPKALRPGKLMTALLFVGGIYFLGLASITFYKFLVDLKWI